MAVIPFSQKKFLFIFIAWWLIWTAMQAWILWGIGFGWETCLVDSVISNLLLAGACILISNNLKYYLPQQQRYGYLLILCLLTAGAWLLAIKYTLAAAVSDAETSYTFFLAKSLPVRFGVAFLVIGCMSMVSVLWYGFEDQKSSAERRTEAEQLTRNAELFKLRQQLQPHFLFNSLNSINALIGTRPQEARTMVLQLSDFLRGTLKREEQQWIALEEELEYLRLYLDIEKVRFGSRLSTHFEISDETIKMKIPAMLLQPLVENAIKFGLYDTTGETAIRITTLTDAGALQVTVSNPFDAATSQPRRGTGFGLHSIQRRLYLLFARNDLLSTTAQNDIFTTTVKIPQPAENRKEVPGNNKAAGKPNNIL